MQAFRTLVGSLILVTVMGAAARGHAADVTASHRLAGQLARSARALLEAEPLTVEAIDGATVLLRQAIALQPDDTDLWRTLLDLARLSEQEEIKREAVARLASLDPRDQVVRLLRINDAMDRYNTVEERAAAYRTLLAPENRDQLGAAVASRLAMDLALLYDRQGDPEQFGHWIAEAVAIDPSNPAAAALAAGFFRMHVRDAFAEAELLMTLLLADPADPVNQAALAQLMLEHGAYIAAVRLYTLGVNTYQATDLEAASNLLADLAIAQWGTGDADAALHTVSVRQQMSDTIARNRAQQANPNLSQAQLNGITGILSPTLAAVRAAIHEARSDPQSTASVDAALVAYQLMAEAEVKKEKPNPAYVASLALESAWLMTWLGNSEERAGRLLVGAEQLRPLSDTARARFGGWLAYKRGDFERAASLLGPVADQDDAARLGLALTRRGQGNLKDAAALLLDVVRAQSGSLMGVYARHELGELLGRPLPPDESAARLNDLVASLPPEFDRYPADPSLVVRLRIRPVKDTFDPYEPIIVEVTLTNNSRYPIAIDPDGPIRPQVLLVPTLTITRELRIDELRPMVVDIDRRLRLQPRETVVVAVDLRRHVLNDVVNMRPLRGATVRLKAISNFLVTPQNLIVPGALGMETQSNVFRIDGVRPSRDWVRQTLEDIQDPVAPADLENMALLGYVVGAGLTQAATPEDLELVEESAARLAEAYARLDPLAQAWLLAVLPGTGRIDPIVTMAQRSENRWVKLAYLLYRVTGLGDPMLAAARRSDDPVLQHLGNMIETGLRRRQEQIPTLGPAESATPQK